MKPRLKKFSRNTVNLVALVAAVRALADERPDFVYKRPFGGNNSCKYKRTLQRDGTLSGCGIGEGLRKIGVSTAGLDRVPGRANTGIITHLERVEHSARHSLQAWWLSAFQDQQDTGTDWGAAKAYADAVYPQV